MEPESLSSSKEKKMLQSVTVNRGLTPSSPGAPAGSPARRPHADGSSVLQADGLDVVRQGGWSCQMQHCYIGPRQVAQSDVCDLQRDLKGIGSVLLQSTQDDGPFRRIG